jgi:predicted adenine nucleotide alpha hydrolase (AANH) superfamily ATPase
MDLKKDYEVVCFWYDPNIQPKKEYNKRLKAFAKVCEIE